MARVHGKDSNFSYNGVAIEDELNSITMNFANAEAEVTAFNDTYGVFLAGKSGVSTDVSGSVDMAASQGDATIFDAIQAQSGALSLIFDVTGSGPGANDPEYTTTASGLTGAIVTSYALALPIGGSATYTATFQHSGSTTRATA